jgi:hypothetical protein
LGACDDVPGPLAFFGFPTLAQTRIQYPQDSDLMMGQAAGNERFKKPDMQDSKTGVRAPFGTTIAQEQIPEGNS